MSSILGPQRFEVIVDREKFEKDLHETLAKALSSTEAPPKEKHVRNALIATWREKGCASFWRVARQFPVLRSHIVCWKTCFVIHRTFRDGYPDVVKKSAQHLKFLSDVGKHWSHAVAGFAPLNTAYIKVLMLRISFYVKNPEVPANLNLEDKEFKVPTNIDIVLPLYSSFVTSALFHLYAAVITSIDPSRGVTAAQIQCRLAPLIPAIQDSAALYDLVFKLMKALHAALPADTLSGHRERFNRQYHALRKYFLEASKMKYLQPLVKIPTLSPDPPSFLLPGELIDQQLSRQVVRMPEQEESSLTSLQGSTAREPSPDPPPRRTDEARFNAAFGSPTSESFDFAPPPRKDTRYSVCFTDIAVLVKHCENVLLKKDLESCQKGASVTAEARVNASEERFVKLKEVYSKLRNEHIQLLRTEGEGRKKLQVTTKKVDQVEKKAEEEADRVTQLRAELEEAKAAFEEETAQAAFLREELRKKEMMSIQLEKTQQSLEQQLQEKEQTAPHHDLVVQAVEESESVIRKVLDELKNPDLGGATCSPAFLLGHTKTSLDVIDSVTESFSVYNSDPSSMGKALSSLSTYTHSMCEVVLLGVATSHLAPVEEGKKLEESTQTIGEQCLEYLSVLKREKPGSGTIASAGNALQKTIRGLGRLAGDLVGEAGEGKEEEALGDVVEEELAATSQAVEEAARRIQEMLAKAREGDSGVKLEVNERILDSCTGLMKTIKTLIIRARDLQGEIIAEGMGSNATAYDFYKKNSRWSEGLISAAKQVGWGATVLVDAADKVVQRTGKFEELMVASHDIAASTAQLVAASRVKARPKSEKLKSLKSSSRDVSEATGQVVASTQSGAKVTRQNSKKMDYTNMSLTQAKRLEMESQVKALELEKELEMERTRLAELRKVHYHLAGASEGWEEEIKET
ncbi:Huntingtin-interacting protein 1 [Geodia barretti]|uniref:Huntingtin-interacting protein 1 n=1 Tax=Geodia barretti TaxID=519541 RepID=A0AA35W281_GEOBA|nr:Huntingtin-interacting protein 1 [Geodia barretti]